MYQITWQLILFLVHHFNCSIFQFTCIFNHLYFYHLIFITSILHMQCLKPYFKKRVQHFLDLREKTSSENCSRLNSINGAGITELWQISTGQKVTVLLSSSNANLSFLIFFTGQMGGTDYEVVFSKGQGNTDFTFQPSRNKLGQEKPNSSNPTLLFFNIKHHV